ncbi:DegV family protein [Atopococcus tabaci]|uniref:DegV family protein n=1 Tax=Atopococcus tabaci TaxID=269774 RepID=UPI00040F134E|nr:DegV family protein [Atopococcus tabaci]
MNKQKIAVLADSGSDVPKEIIEKYNVKVIPLKIIFKEGEYIDKVTITADEVYTKMKNEIPTTSLPGADDIKQLLDEIKAEGYEKVLAVTISSGLSGTYNMVRLVAEDYEGLDIFAVDTKNIGIGSGFAAIEAARLADEDVEWETIKEKLLRMVERSKVFFHVPTLEYLQKGGRIGLVTSVVGSLLNLKPIISCNDEGIYYTVAKVRGTKKSIEKMVQLAQEFAEPSKKYNLALVYGGEGVVKEAEKIKQELMSRLANFKEIFFDQVSPALGVHTGPGLIGVGVQLLEDE